jgi:hypothetical protein
VSTSVVLHNQLEVSQKNYMRTQTPPESANFRREGVPHLPLRLYFLSPSDTPLAAPDVAFMALLKAEMLGRLGHAEAATPEEADALLLHEPWDFREWRYIQRLRADPIVSRFAHKVFTINNDDAASGLLRGVYSCLPANRIDHELHALVPFLRAANDVVLQRAGQPRPPADRLAAWFGNPKSSKVRRRLYDRYKTSNSLKLMTTSSWMQYGTDERTMYAEMLHAGKFALCPSGWAPATLRLYESMAMGVAPVLVADSIELPKGPDWDEFAIRVREADLGRLEKILAPHAPRYLEMGARAHAAWAKYFSPDQLVPYYAQALLRCIRAAQARESSPAQEFARWRSVKMAWSNNWTLPQRVLNRIRRAFEAGKKDFSSAPLAAP